MEKVTHGKMNSRVRRSFLSLEAKQKIRWDKKRKEKKGRRKEKGKKEKKNEEKENKMKKMKENEEKQKGWEGESCVQERRKKKKTALPFAISGEPAIEMFLGKKQSWST